MTKDKDGKRTGLPAGEAFLMQETGIGNRGRNSMKCRGFEIVSGWEARGIRLPVRKTASSAGYDLEAGVDVLVPAGKMAMVPTGIKAYMNSDEVLYLFVRSSLAARHHIVLANGTGVIDADYYGNEENEGHIFIALQNGGEEDVLVRKGDRIAQGIFQAYLTVDDDRAGIGAVRQGGFGSTGRA